MSRITIKDSTFKPLSSFRGSGRFPIRDTHVGVEVSGDEIILQGDNVKNRRRQRNSITGEVPVTSGLVPDFFARTPAKPYKRITIEKLKD